MMNQIKVSIANATAIVTRMYNVWKDGIQFKTNSTYLLHSEECDKACKSQNAKLLNSALGTIISGEQMILFLFVGVMIGYLIGVMKWKRGMYRQNLIQMHGNNRRALPRNEGRREERRQSRIWPVRNRRTFPHIGRGQAPGPGDVMVLPRNINTRGAARGHARQTEVQILSPSAPPLDESLVNNNYSSPSAENPRMRY